MGNPTGFMDYARRSTPLRTPRDRVLDYEYIYTELEPTIHQQQAARCMDCGVPFCQAATHTPAPEAAETLQRVMDAQNLGCPLHNLIPEVNQQFARGNMKCALERLTKTNCFPEFTGYVCPALCERACSCGKFDSAQAVATHDNERYLISHAFDTGLMKPRIPLKRSGMRVAVVGSGPAGLSVAHLLNQRGHNVVVYEREQKPGGLLVYGIPSMKLPKSVVARRVHLMQEEGVEFTCNANVGKDVSVHALCEQFDAVVLALGAQEPRKVNFKGAANVTTGIVYALDYLRASSRSLMHECALDNALDAHDKQVVVIGAGDTANDCIAVMLRQGAREIVQCIRRPASDYAPMKDYAHEEALATFKCDIRHFETRVSAVSTENTSSNNNSVESSDKKLRSVCLATPAGETSISAQLLIIASGFSGAQTYATKHLDSFEHKNLFFAGDMVSGASLVAHAMAQARSVAHTVDEYLLGYSTIDCF